MELKQVWYMRQPYYQSALYVLLTVWEGESWLNKYAIPDLNTICDISFIYVLNLPFERAIQILASAHTLISLFHIKLCLLLCFEFFANSAIVGCPQGFYCRIIQNRAQQAPSLGEKFSVEQIFTQE